MIASLPMYDWPELQEAHDTMWRDLGEKLHRSGLEVPGKLAHDDTDESHWLNPDLLLGQTCGYPLATILKGKVAYVATPVYSVQGCSGPNYSSAIVVRRDSGLTMQNWQKARFAFNAQMSLSGYRAIKAMVGEPEDFFAGLVETGGHRASAKMVASGDGDVATLDAVCWHLVQQYEPEIAEQLSVIGWTEMRPALPLITSLGTPQETIAKIRAALNNITPPRSLAISGFEILKLSDYNKLSAL